MFNKNPKERYVKSFTPVAGLARCGAVIAMLMSVSACSKEEFLGSREVPINLEYRNGEKKYLLKTEIRFSQTKMTYTGPDPECFFLCIGTDIVLSDDIDLRGVPIFVSDRKIHFLYMRDKISKKLLRNIINSSSPECIDSNNFNGGYFSIDSNGDNKRNYDVIIDDNNFSKFTLKSICTKSFTSDDILPSIPMMIAFEDTTKYSKTIDQNIYQKFGINPFSGGYFITISDDFENFERDLIQKIVEAKCIESNKDSATSQACTGQKQLDDWFKPNSGSD